MSAVDVDLSAPEQSIAEYLADVRAVLHDKRGGRISWALSQPFVLSMLDSLHAAGAHAGYAADEVRRYIATRHDVGIARRHEQQRKERTR